MTDKHAGDHAILRDDLYGTTVFEIIGHNLEFTGLCPQCSGQRNQRQAAG